MSHSLLRLALLWDLGISIVHDAHELVAVIRIWKWPKYVHGDELQYATGREEFYVSCSPLIRTVACASMRIGHSCVYIAGHVRPIYLASDGVVPVALCGVYGLSWLVIRT